MPMLDVSFVLSDPMFEDEFSITRRPFVLEPNGRPAEDNHEDLPGLTGVITQQDPTDLMRTEEGQLVPRSILVVTRTQVMAGGTAGFLSDLINWNGGVYEVKSVIPYSRFGAGFYEVVAHAKTGVNPVQ